jgi:hypothetical protein
MEHSHVSRTNKPGTVEDYLDIFRDQLLSDTSKYSWRFPLESNLRTAYNKKIQFQPLELLEMYSILQKAKYFKKTFCTTTIIPEISMKQRLFRCHVASIDDWKE